MRALLVHIIPLHIRALQPDHQHVDRDNMHDFLLPLLILRRCQSRKAAARVTGIVIFAKALALKSGRDRSV